MWRWCNIVLLTTSQEPDSNNNNNNNASLAFHPGGKGLRPLLGTVYGQNGDKPKRRHAKTATNHNGDTAIRRRPERRQTETATSQNGDTAV